MNVTVCSLFPLRPGRCGVCDVELPKGRRSWCSRECAEAFYSQHIWGFARPAVLKRDGYACRRCGGSGDLEVNHIIPRNGLGYGNGCHHHQDNLETLCRQCHTTVTISQRRARAGQRRVANYIRRYGDASPLSRWVKERGLKTAKPRKAEIDTPEVVAPRFLMK